MTQISTIPTNEIFFFGWFNKSDASLQPFTNSEIDSLYNWSKRGGKLIIGTDPDGLPTFNSSILNAKWGYSLTQATSSLFPTSEGNASDIFNGPFGNVPTVNEGGSLQGFFNTIPANSVVLAREAFGNPTLYLDCNTLDLIAADIDIFTTVGGISSDSNINNNQDKFLANVFVYMDKLQNPPVITNNGTDLSCTNIYSNYQWYIDGGLIPNATNQEYFATQNGSYSVEATLDCGCKLFSNSIIFDTLHDEETLFVPNIFSPNGDLNNDVLYVRSHNIKTMDFCIYNRWGEKVFESKDINKGWDGTFKDSKCSEGVFVYYLNATLKNDKQIMKKGNVTLIR